MDEQYRIEKEEEVFLKLKEIITEIIGEDEAEIIGIQRDSAFLKDLMIDSIQIAAIAERVHGLYGDDVDFVSWLSSRPVRKWKNLTVGEVSEFIAGQLIAARAN